MAFGYFTLISFLFFGTLAKAELKIGVVDMQKAVQATDAGKKAKTELEGSFDKKKKELETQETDLRKKGEDLGKKKAVLSERALSQKQAELQEDMVHYRETLAKSQAEMQKRQQELMTPILEKMKKVLAKVGHDKGYGLVLEKTPEVLYFPAEEDITDPVIKAFVSEP